MRLIFMVIAAVYMVLSAAPAMAAAEPAVRAVIAQDQHSVEITAPEETAFFVDGRKMNLPFLPQATRVILAAEHNGFSFNAVPFNAATLVVLQAPEGKSIEVNRRSYRGAILVRRGKDEDNFQVINQLPIEQYLYGVVPKEMPSAWPKDALKAQAVAVRSFTLAMCAQNRQLDYDIPFGTQVYGGFSAEQPAVTQAVDETHGMILTYNGSCIQSYYYSVSGGYTESSRDAWGTAKPYLQAVADVKTQSPQESWEKLFKPELLDQLLVQAGFDIGALDSIQLSVLKTPPIEEVDRSISGRVRQVRLIGSKGELVLDGNRMRQLLQLPSTLFDVALVSKTPKNIETTITDSYGNPVLEKKIPVAVGDQPLVSLPADAQKNLHRIVRSDNTFIRFSGHGFGHGVGMSQWGAKTIAEQATAGEQNVYQRILGKYYQGVTLARAYDD